MKVAGLIICGGRSTRMGVSKAMLPVGDETLVQRMVRLIAPDVAEVIVSTARQQELPALPPSVIRVEDRQPDRGPIEGLRNGLAAAEQTGCEAAFVAAVDLPLLRPAMIPRLAGLLGPDADAAVPVHDGVRQPLTGLYRTHVYRTVDGLIDEGRLSLQAVLDRLSVRLVHGQALGDIDPECLSFRNINTQADYQQLLSRLDREGGSA